MKYVVQKCYHNLITYFSKISNKIKTLDYISRAFKIKKKITIFQKVVERVSCQRLDCRKLLPALLL